jgi:hypothetical protein
VSTVCLRLAFYLISHSDFFAGEIGDYVFRDYEIKGNKRLRSLKAPEPIWIIQKVGSGLFHFFFGSALPSTTF